MLFLKNLDRIEVKKNAVLNRCFERITHGDDILINDGTSDRVWHLIHGTFNQAANGLRERHGDRIEKKRSANVVIAIPSEPFDFDSGLLCAFLPTQYETGLPFHVNADFFPSSDRKKIIFESDYQSEWNRAALNGAAEAFQAGFDRLPDLLGHKSLWRVIESVYRVGQEAARGEREKTLGQFWNRISSVLRTSRIVYTNRENWCQPAEVVVLEREEEEAIQVLNALDVAIVHPDVRPYIFRLPRREVLGLDLLDIEHVVRGLQARGLTVRTEVHALPVILRNSEGLQVLWREVGRLLKRRRRPEEQRAAEQALAMCAIAPCKDGTLWPCREVYQANQETVALFSKINPSIPFLAETGEDGDAIKNLCPEFSASAAVEWLGRFTPTELEQANSEDRLDPSFLLSWFEARREEILHSPDLKHRLTELSIFPSSAGLRPLSALALPGDFTDPLGLTAIVDVNRLCGRRDFLHDLGASQLTFLRYVKDLIPRAFCDPAVTSAAKKCMAVLLLADRLGEIRDDMAARDALVSVPIVECEDSVFRGPGETYFKDSITTTVLYDKINCAVIPTEHQDAIRELYRWIGVAEKPRLQDIIARIRVLATAPPTEDSVRTVQSILSHLGERIQNNGEDMGALSTLRAIAWLPARGQVNRWYCPQELYAVFQDYLFESQALFLDVPRDIQNSSRDFLRFLGINDSPATSQVVAHLLKCSEQETSVNKEVYRFLNDNAQDPAVTQLKGKKCLLLPNGKYVKPDQVFWSEHPFGWLRYRLGPDLRRYGELFSRLGVREVPNHEDARHVILDISTEYVNSNRRLDDDDYNVLLACWRMLDQATKGGVVSTEFFTNLRDQKAIPNAERVLHLPKWIFFEDRTGLAAKFGPFLQNNVIPRPQGAWQAMSEAGVRTLSSAVKSHLVECIDPSEDTSMSRLLSERRLQLARVLEAQDAEARLDPFYFGPTAVLRRARVENSILFTCFQ